MNGSTQEHSMGLLAADSSSEALPDRQGCL